MYKINRVSDSELKCRNYGELTFGRKQIRCCATAASRCYILALIFGRVPFSFQASEELCVVCASVFTEVLFYVPKSKKRT